MEQTIAIDVTPVLASRTGVGIYLRELVHGLLELNQGSSRARYRICAATWNGSARRRLAEAFPPGACEILVRPCPMRILGPLANRGPWPTVEALFGHPDVFHGGPLLVPSCSKSVQVVTVNDLSPVRYPEYHLSSNSFGADEIRRRLKRASLVISPSQSTARDLEDLAGVPPEIIRVIPLASRRCFRPLGDRPPALAEKLLSGGDYLLAVGAIEPRKNLGRLLEAFRLLKDRDRITHKLAIVGPEGWRMGPLADTAAALGISDSLVFTGFVDEENLNCLYNGATLLVYPSLYEGFGLPPLEAMAAGCPVAVSRVSSLPEVVGDAGLYFEPENVEEMAQTISRVLESPDLRRDLAARGLRRSSEFSWTKTAAATRQVYSEAIALGHPTGCAFRS